MILLTGTTGMIGGHVARALAGQGLPVRAMVRDLDKAKSVAELGIDLVQGDMTDRVSLEAALDGAEKAFFLMNNSEAQLDNERRFIDAAASAGIKHAVKLSAVGARAGDDHNILKHYHGASEDHLKTSGMAYTIVRPNFFMQYILFFMPMVEKAGGLFLPGGEGKMAPVDGRDVAEVIALALTQPGHTGQTYELSGPELLSYSDIAAAFSAALGKPVTRTQIPEEAYIDAMRNIGLPAWNARAVAIEMSHLGSGDAGTLHATYESLTGKKPTALKAFLADSLTPSA